MLNLLPIKGANIHFSPFLMRKELKVLPHQLHHYLVCGMLYMQCVSVLQPNNSEVLNAEVFL